MNKDLRIIAEVGSVHDGSLGNALKLIDLAAECGADIVKFQTHIAEAETIKDAPNPSYFSQEPRFDYFKRTGFSPAEWRQLKKHADKNKIGFLSSPFSLEAVDLLEDVGVSLYKIPSGEVTNIPLLDHIAKTGKEVLLSSGMSNWAELDKAVAALKPCKLTIMQCSSEYPCQPENVGINVIEELAARYKMPVGYSDHTLGFAAAILAVAAGASVIEKHITFSKAMYGSDAKHSMEPDEFKIFCKALREATKILENPVDKADASRYAEMKTVFEKSLVTKISIQKGTVISTETIAFKKPGTGISAARYKEFIGKKFAKDLPPDHILTEKDIING